MFYYKINIKKVILHLSLCTKQYLGGLVLNNHLDSRFIFSFVAQAYITGLGPHDKSSVLSVYF